MPEPEQTGTTFTLLRDEQGYVWWLVNGTPAPAARPQQFLGELRYDSLGIVRSSDGKAVIDLADFCLYDRGLTEAELGTLTGLQRFRTATEAPAACSPEGETRPAPRCGPGGQPKSRGCRILPPV